MADTAPGRRVQRVRHATKRRELTVLRVDDLSPHLRSITFGGDTLADFTSDSFDDHVKFLLDLGDGQPVGRDYTPRRFDRAARELVIEFALHGDGPASRWAAQAAPGQRATVGGPRGSFIVPLDYEWHLLVGDTSALPAIARRLQELPAGSRALAIVEAPLEDRRDLATQAELTLAWVANAAEGLAALRALALPPGEGYAWCAGEARTVAEARRILVEDKGQDRHAIRAAAYWKRGVVAHHESLE
ncbi:MAG: FAD-binding protein [Ramlibacter sp.]|uniref:siderophore-interacting protein n=1 Tax=Ramlibacter sp. TaxID=1917967 RepID=UPI00260F91F0|nr:siderophore-interacting protein [Ramlibacter sp.]MDB5753001.1 FAD-binding protein [Ramlibacter sp.]